MPLSESFSAIVTRALDFWKMCIYLLILLNQTPTSCWSPKYLLGLYECTTTLGLDKTQLALLVLYFLHMNPISVISYVLIFYLTLVKNYCHLCIKQALLSHFSRELRCLPNASYSLWLFRYFFFSFCVLMHYCIRVVEAS